ncbi:MAG TPA: DUF2017 domain-containing protein, partial [Streptosporangiaceae bacterium]
RQFERGLLSGRGRPGRQEPDDVGGLSGAGRPGQEEPDDLDDMSAEELVEVTMAGFRRTVGGVSAKFTAAEAGVVRALVSQIAELLGGDPAAADPAAQPPPEPGTGPLAGSGAAEPAPWTADDLEALLRPAGPVEPPADPAIARLLPNGYRDDPEAAGEFRRYTEQGLRSGKVAAARTVLATLPGDGGRVRLGREDAEVWLRALNDVRLALGVRLEITEDYEHELADDSGTDPRSAYLQVYDWLTFLQESLVRALW